MNALTASILGASLVIASLVLALAPSQVPRPAEPTPAAALTYAILRADDNTVILLNQQTGRLWRIAAPSDEYPSSPPWKDLTPDDLAQGRP